MDYFFYNTDARSLKEEPRPRYQVLINNGLAVVGGDREKYGEQFRPIKPDDVLFMYENDIGVVSIGKAQEAWDGATHSDSLYYKPSEMDDLDGGHQEYRIAVDWFLDLSAVPIGLNQLRERLGYTPMGAVQRVVTHRAKAANMVEELRQAHALLPGGVPKPAKHLEGSLKQIWVNAYERSRSAVEDAKKIHGTSCVVCGIDFGKVYGEEFEGFIHIHHLKPLSTIGQEYEVDPENDLRPVCPNCHSVIHFGAELRTVEKVRELYARGETNPK